MNEKSTRDFDSYNPVSILFLTLHFPPQLGAAATRVDSLTTRWADAGHDVSVVTPVPDDADGEIHPEFTNQWITREECRRVTIYRLKTISAADDSHVLRRTAKYLWFAASAVAFSLIRTRPDVVIGTSPQLFTAFGGLLFASLSRIPFVFDVRDLWPESLKAMGYNEKTTKYRLLDVTAEILYRWSSIIIVATPGIKSAIVSKGVRPDAVKVHTNGIEPKFYNRGPEDHENRLQGLERIQNRFAILYVGSVERVHGLSVALSAAECIGRDPGYEDVVFAIIGFGTQYDSLRKEAEARGLDNVEFLGSLPKKRIPEYLASADAGLVHLIQHQLFRTAIPSKSLEAMAAGLPVLMGLAGDAAELVEEAEAGLSFPPEDAEALADAVRRLHDNPELVRRLSRNAELTARTLFDWENIAADYLLDIKMIVSEST